jgi:hypothetical protein
LIGATPAVAQTPRGLQSGQDTKVDLTETPVLANSRVVAMGGAYTAIAEESVAIPFNPAAVAHRPYYSLDWWDWHFNWDLFAPGLLQSDQFDFDNSGVSSSDGFLAFAIGVDLQLKSFGVGLHFRGQEDNLQRTTGAGEELRAATWVGQLALGYGFLDHRIVVGAAFKVGSFALGLAEELLPEILVGGFGLGFDLGVLIRSWELPLRVGIGFSSPLYDVGGSYICDHQQCPEDAFLPNGLTAGWELRIGAAWQFSFDGQRFNPRPEMRSSLAKEVERRAVRDHKSRLDLNQTYRGGRYLLLSAEAVLVGPVDKAVGKYSLVVDTPLPAGEELSIGVRFGAEGEVVKRRLRLRAGGYWEPSRYTGQTGRMHGTFGLLVRMFDLTIPFIGRYGLCFSASMDLSRRYSNVIASVLNFWY